MQATNFNVCRCTLVALILACFVIKEAHGYCSLENMKINAVEACERMFQQDEGRERRSIDNNKHHLNKLSHDKHVNVHYIGRSTYPAGGYLKVSKDHYHRLISLDVIPRYKSRKQHLEKKMRYKRDHVDKRYNNISYCCYHHCNDDFFC